MKAAREPENCRKDIVSGSRYQEQIAKNFNGHQHPITLFFSADGVPLCRSNTKSAWIFSAYTIEIPPQYRYSFRNMCLFQYSIGPIKPYLSVTLARTLKQLVQLKEHDLELYFQNRSISFHVDYLFFVADFPALYLFLNFISSTGYNSCFTCLAPGDYDRQLGKVVYQKVGYQLRTNRMYYDDLKIARQKKAISQAMKKIPTCPGIKGESVLDSIFPDKLITSVNYDYMHSTIKCVSELRMDWTESIVQSSPAHVDWTGFFGFHGLGLVWTQTLKTMD
ncbi:unnamed protein product [Didymodactylos carnosus]|uniref:Uncharacterized protein n=1 Tax=Didymodactylos carnosus TaxID=1234261 RepID=A0A816C829_9BILA|nr:unnamed protein product [Didymodactylos carnosus]CAF4509380.1 unnamed protein product [Didymodactylos carnosus]